MQSCDTSLRTHTAPAAQALGSFNTFITGTLKVAAFAFSMALVGCDGGAIVFDGGSNARKDIDENTAGVIWSAKARIGSVASPGKLVYELKGVDADAFLINSATGEVSFKTPADFERPVDADKNNEYLFSVESKADGKSALQQVSLLVKNATQPVVELIKPQPFENVGTGDPVEVETLVKFYDAESNTPFVNGNITLNSMPMEASGEDAKIWKSKIAVAEGGMDLDISASASTLGAINRKEKLLNKRNAANVSFLWAVQGDWMMVAGGGLDWLTKYNLSTKEMYDDGLGGFHDESLSGLTAIKCRPYVFVCYALGGWELELGFNFEENGPGFTFFFVRNILRETPQEKRIDLAVDEAHSRMVFVSETPNEFSLSTVDIAALGGDQPGSPLFKMPRSTFSSGFKQFAVHGQSNTFIFTELREINGIAHHYIRGFDEAGVQRFEVRLGADISNLVVDEMAGLIYVADNNKTYRAKLLAIDVANGEVRELMEKKSEVPHGAFTGLTLDQINNRLYIGDSVSDAIYMLDLANKIMQDLPYKYTPASNVGLPED
jgi:hypothetical protein